MGLQEPQTSGHRNLSWEKKWHDSEGAQPGLQRPLLGLGLPRGCGERCCIPRLPLRAPTPPPQGLGNIKAGPAGPSVLTSAHSRSWLVLGWGRL